MSGPSLTQAWCISDALVRLRAVILGLLGIGDFRFRVWVEVLAFEFFWGLGLAFSILGFGVGFTVRGLGLRA